MTKKKLTFHNFPTEKDIANVGKSGLKPVKEKMLMEASGKQKEDMFTYAQNILLQVCLIWVFKILKAVPGEELARLLLVIMGSYHDNYLAIMFFIFIF